MASSLHTVVLAAGEGTRLGGSVPKVLTPLWGRPAVAWALEAAAPLKPGRQVVVAGRHLEALKKALPSDALSWALQDDPQGTGHALLCAREALEGATGRLILLYGDCPMIRPELLEELLEVHDGHRGSLSLLTMELEDPTGYGRILRDGSGRITAIVEEKDADEAEKTVCEVNTGIWVLDLPAGLERLDAVGRDNAQGEIYLTDLVGLAHAAGEEIGTLCWPEPEDVLGFNDQTELALVRGILRERILGDLLEDGVEIVDPATTFVDITAQIEPGAQLLPCTMIEGHTQIAAGCVVGPFAHLRDGTILEAGAKVGNFTETKKTRLGAGAKASHLTYLGDAEVGAGTNIGCGTITANYDGKNKHATHIGAGAFIGSGTVLVAPSEVGDGARTGAGAIVTGRSVIAAGETWVGLPARPHAAKNASDADSAAPEPSK